MDLRLSSIDQSDGKRFSLPVDGAAGVHGQVASIHRQKNSGDHGSGIRREEDRRADHFLRFTQAAEGDPADHRFQEIGSFRIGDLGGPQGIHELAGEDGVDADAVPGLGEGQFPRELTDPGLGDPVGHGTPSQRVFPGDGTEIHDAARAFCRDLSTLVLRKLKRPGTPTTQRRCAGIFGNERGPILFIGWSLMVFRRRQFLWIAWGCFYHVCGENGWRLNALP